MKSKSGLIAASVLAVLVLGYAAYQLTRSDERGHTGRRGASSEEGGEGEGRPANKRRRPAFTGPAAEDPATGGPGSRAIPRAKPLPPAEPTPPAPGSEVTLEEGREKFAEIMAELRTHVESEGRMDQPAYEDAYVRSMKALDPLMYHLDPGSEELGDAQRERMQVLQDLEPRVN